MSDERKYGQDEVSEIFALATDAVGQGLTAPAPEEGMTLGELQEVGREVGLAPDRVAQAAASLDSRPQALQRQTFLGLPVSAGRITELPRAATEREWQILVTDIRETFGAKGALSSHGDIREWSNGNLHVFLEPTEAGHRLRLVTHKSEARLVTVLGGLGLLIGTLLFLLFWFEGISRAGFFFPVVIGLGGGGALARNLVVLPRWADERERQMEHIAGRARALLASPPVEKDT